MGIVSAVFGTHSDREIKRLTPLVDRVMGLEEEYSKLTDKELQAKTPEFKEISEGHFVSCHLMGKGENHG